MALAVGSVGLISFLSNAFFTSERMFHFEALNRFETNFDPKEFTKMKKYIQEFFDVLIDDKLFRSKILASCRTE